MSRTPGGMNAKRAVRSMECSGTGKVHRDAVKIIEYLIGENGSVTCSNGEIARKLGFLQNKANGVYLLDQGRFQRARAHINDARTSDDKPCCSYNVNYRRSGGGGSWLALIDPTGHIEDHWRAALGDALGLMSRERQHQTEICRSMQQLEDLADFALSRGDKAGYRICQHVITDLDHYSTIHADTLGKFIMWAEELAAEEAL